MTVLGYTNFAVKRYFELMGEQPAYSLMKANDKPLPKTIRCNTLLTSPSILKKSLESKGFKIVTSNLGDYIFFVRKEPFSIGATNEFLMGHYYVQDLASMCPPIEAEPKGAKLVFDACAAPGGKTTHMSQLMNNKGTIIAADIDRHRMKALRTNVQRCNCKNTLLVRIDSNYFTDLKIKPQIVLLDVPCSGEGVVRKDPSVKSRITKNYIQKYVKMQREIIDNIIPNLEKGTTVVYSTCTIAPEENEFQVQHMIEDHGMELQKLKLKWYSPGLTNVFGTELPAEMKKCGRLWPHVQNTTGFFVAKMKKGQS
jgi:NOL1/NOP2/sun family putative RNA methylase